MLFEKICELELIFWLPLVHMKNAESKIKISVRPHIPKHKNNIYSSYPFIDIPFLRRL